MPVWNTADHLACILQLIAHTRIPRLKTLGLNPGSILKASSSEHLHLGEHKGKGTKTMHWKESGREVSFPFLSYESSSVLIPTASILCCTSQTKDHAKSIGALKGRLSCTPWHRQNLHTDTETKGIGRKEAAQAGTHAPSGQGSICGQVSMIPGASLNLLELWAIYL